ncbi:MAG: GAF domain-containing protein [Deltaproteobacteria bacterium]|nr:GAF domain-containing protein [Deltaproteobacteria bacterium]
MKEKVDILKTNEEISLKFGKIEENLASFLNVKDLFEKLIIQIQEEFRIPFVWISIISEPYLADVIQVLKSSRILKERLNIIDRAAFLQCIANSTKPILANNYMKPFYKLLPRNKKYFVKSLAIAPITLNSEIIGSINHGDFSNLRYQPGMDTSLLEKLASNISARLSNIMIAPQQETE